MRHNCARCYTNLFNKQMNPAMCVVRSFRSFPLSVVCLLVHYPVVVKTPETIYFERTMNTDRWTHKGNMLYVFVFTFSFRYAWYTNISLQKQNKTLYSDGEDETWMLSKATNMESIESIEAPLSLSLTPEGLKFVSFRFESIGFIVHAWFNVLWTSAQ